MLVFLTTKIFINYSDHEDIYPLTSTKVYLLSHRVMGNIHLSFIFLHENVLGTYTVCFPVYYSVVYCMHGSRSDKNDVYWVFVYVLRQRFTTFFDIRDQLHEDNFSMDQGLGGWFQADSNTWHLLCTLFLSNATTDLTGGTSPCLQFGDLCLKGKQAWL